MLFLRLARHALFAGALRSDAALLACRSLDQFSDGLILGNLVFYLSERLMMSDLAVGIVIGILDFSIRVYIASGAGRLQDEWPRSDVLRLTMATKLCAAAVAFVVATVGLLSSQPTWSFFSVVASCVLLCVGFAASEAYSGYVYFHAINSTTERRTERARRVLFALDHAVANLASALSRLVVVAVRATFAPDYRMADTIIFYFGGSMLIASSILARVIWHTYFRAREDTLLHPMPREGGGDSETSAAPPFSWKTLSMYVRYIAMMSGTDFLYEQLGIVLPKYLVRRFGLTTIYPLFQTINPFIVFFLTPVATAFLREHEPLRLVAIGTAIMVPAVASIGLTASTGWIAVALIVLTVGESISIPQLNTYVSSSVVPRGDIGRYAAICTIPRGLIGVCLTTASGLLLGRFCPSESACGSNDSQLMWLIIGAVASVTPIGSTALLVYKRCQT